MLLRNIKSLVRRYPVAVVLNFTGLVAALLAFSLIILQAQYELSFDKCHPTSERIFRADQMNEETYLRNILPRGFADDIIRSSAHIEAGCTIAPYSEICFTVKEEGREDVGYKENALFASSRFIDVFGLHMVEGDNHALEGNTPSSVIIPQSLARKLFPDEPALGKVLKTNQSTFFEKEGEAVITGVYEDFPSNTQLSNAVYMELGNMFEDNYWGSNFICYLLLDEVGHAKEVADEFNGKFDFGPYEGRLSPIELVPFTSIYFRNEGSVYKGGSRGQLILLLAIAFAILAIGLINYTNFYVALTPLRIRSINLQKVLGSSVARLRGRVLAESLIWSFGAFVVVALLLRPVSRELVTQGVMMQAFSMENHSFLLLSVGVIALLTGWVAGIWPAVYSTSGEPALTLKGKFGLSQSGKTFRTVLVGIQFIVSIALLVFAFYVQRQSRFMQEYPCGYDKENLAVVDLDEESVWTRRAPLKERLCQLPEVEGVAYTADLLGGGDLYGLETFDFGKGDVTFHVVGCSPDLPQVLGIDVTEGRDFREGDSKKVLFTQNAREKGVEMKDYGEALHDLGVIGFVEDVSITSLRVAKAPVAFIVSSDGDMENCLFWAYIRLVDGTDRFSAMEKIRAVMKEMDPTYPYEVRFYDSIGKNLYTGEERLRHSIWLFSLLAILLSLVGIWGQVLMDVQYKKGEISTKRVFGADTRRIIGEGLRIYLRTYVICYAIGAPIGWFVVQYYLQQFVDRVGFTPVVFLQVFVLVGLLCSGVVLYHYSKLARTNPADTLKSE